MFLFDLFDFSLRQLIVSFLSSQWYLTGSFLRFSNLDESSSNGRCLTECFSPPDLARIVFLCKVFMALVFTKLDHLAVVDKHVVAGVNGPQTLHDTHFELMWKPITQTQSLKGSHT